MDTIDAEDVERKKRAEKAFLEALETYLTPTPILASKPNPTWASKGNLQDVQASYALALEQKKQAIYRAEHQDGTGRGEGACQPPPCVTLRSKQTTLSLTGRQAWA